jgi:hypothetical protein
VYWKNRETKMQRGSGEAYRGHALLALSCLISSSLASKSLPEFSCVYKILAVVDAPIRPPHREVSLKEITE